MADIRRIISEHPDGAPRVFYCNKCQDTVRASCPEWSLTTFCPQCYSELYYAEICDQVYRVPTVWERFLEVEANVKYLRDRYQPPFSGPSHSEMVRAIYAAQERW